MVILCSRDLATMTTVDAALLAAGIDDIVWHHTMSEGAYELHVREHDAERAGCIIAALWTEEQELTASMAQAQATAVAPPAADLAVWQQPAFAWGVGMAGLLLAFYAVTGGSDADGVWYERGVFIHMPGSLPASWRWVTAATLHAHMAHASGNAAMALIMFWAASERVGQGVATWVWLATAVAGFGASALCGPAPARVVGASGGLFGLWGAVCGHAWRYPPASGYKPRMRTVGAVTMLLGMMAFARDADVAAHLGGCVAGLGIGLVCPRKPLHAGAQWACVLWVVAAVGWSWASALAGRSWGF